jgi:hypothetical protein
MWVVVMQTGRYTGDQNDGRLRPDSVVGPFDDRRAAQLWSEKMHKDSLDEGRLKIIQLTFIPFHSEDGPAALVPGPGEEFSRILQRPYYPLSSGELKKYT